MKYFDKLKEYSQMKKSEITQKLIGFIFSLFNQTCILLYLPELTYEILLLKIEVLYRN